MASGIRAPDLPSRRERRKNCLGPVSYTHLTGSDANEFALKLAKYFRGGGRIISFRRGFHGSTAGAAAATGKSEMIQENSGISELLPRGFVHSAPPYCYHCDFGKEPDTCGMQCLKYLEQTMLHEGGDRIAAVISEPIFAAGGVIVPPNGFWKGVRELCDKYGCLLYTSGSDFHCH